MAMYIGQSRYNVYLVNGITTVEGDAEQPVADIINGTATQISNSKVTNVRDYFFQSCSTLTAVDFPECLSIGSWAFYSCESLSVASFSKCISIGKAAFDDCRGLNAISFPECEVIGERAFGYCMSLSGCVEFPNCTEIGAEVFNYDRFEEAKFPKCITIGRGAFSKCGELSKFEFPVCTTIGSQAFSNCINIEYLNSNSFPACTTIGNGAFEGCTRLSEVTFLNCITIGNNAFHSLKSSLCSVDFPACTNVGYGAFGLCYSLANVNLPNCVSIGSWAFGSCRSLTSINLPACASISEAAFFYCSRLSNATFSSLSYIGSQAFYSCKSLMTFMNYYSSVAMLYNASVFYNTPMSNSTYTGSFGSIFVPVSLVSLYKTATNWVAYANRIAPLESIEQIDDVIIGYNTTKSIVAPLIRFESTPENISVVSNNENVVISNIQATNESITFDATANDTAADAECNIEATYNEKLYTMSFTINAVHPIDVENITEKLGVNGTSSISVSYYGDSIATGLSVTSSDENKLSISNARLVDNAITFDATTYDVEGEVSIVISIAYGGKTYSQTKAITISRAPAYTIEDLGTVYGFVLNDNGYYESNNKGVQNSYAICKVNINAPIDCTMYLDCINYAEANYDYGILSNLDTTLSLSSSADSSYKKSFKGSSKAAVQTVSYDVTAGEHFIYVKYRKDNSSDSNNDSLQFAIRFE